jgi:hypothetical protein
MIEAILKDPENAELTTIPDTLSALADQATPETFKSITAYALRLFGEGAKKSALRLIRDSLRRSPILQFTEEMVQIARSPIGGWVLSDAPEVSEILGPKNPHGIF